LLALSSARCCPLSRWSTARAVHRKKTLKQRCRKPLELWKRAAAAEMSKRFCHGLWGIAAARCCSRPAFVFTWLHRDGFAIFVLILFSFQIHSGFFGALSRIESLRKAHEQRDPDISMLCSEGAAAAPLSKNCVRAF
jgi:hypothetical protein